MDKTPDVVFPDDLCKKLAFQRGLMSLMKGTVPLYSPMIDKALEDIDELMEKVG